MLLTLGLAVALATPGAVALAAEHHAAKPLRDEEGRLRFKAPDGGRYAFDIEAGRWYLAFEPTDRNLGVRPADSGDGVTAPAPRIVEVMPRPDGTLVRKLHENERMPWGLSIRTAQRDAEPTVEPGGHHAEPLTLTEQGRVQWVGDEGEIYEMDRHGHFFLIYRPTSPRWNPTESRDPDSSIRAERRGNELLVRVFDEDVPELDVLELEVAPPDASATGEQLVGPHPPDRLGVLETRAVELLRMRHNSAYQALVKAEEAADRSWAAQAWAAWRDSDLQALLARHQEREEQLAEAQRQERAGLERNLERDLRRVVKALAQRIWSAEREAEQAVDASTTASAADENPLATALRRFEIEQRLVALLQEHHRAEYDLLQDWAADDRDTDRARVAQRVWRGFTAAFHDQIQDEIEGSLIADAADTAPRPSLDPALRPWVTELARHLRAAEERRQTEAQEAEVGEQAVVAEEPDEAAANKTDESRPAVVIAEGGQRPAEVLPGDGGQTVAPVLPSGEGCVSRTPSLGQAQASAPCAGQAGIHDATVVNPTWLGETGAEDPVLVQHPLPAAPAPVAVTPTDPQEPGREPEPEVAVTPVQQASELIEPDPVTLVLDEPTIEPARAPLEVEAEPAPVQVETEVAPVSAPVVEQPQQPRAQAQPEIHLGGTSRIQAADPSIGDPIAKPDDPNTGLNVVQGGGFGFLAD